MFHTLVLAAVLSGAPAQAVAPVTDEFTATAFEYPDALVEAATFTRCLDAQPCVTKKPAEIKVVRAADAPPDTSTYAFAIPALSVGLHADVIRACSVDIPTLCAPEATVSFKLVISPVAVINPRVSK